MPAKLRNSISKNILENLYIEKGLSLLETAKQLKFSSRTIEIRAKELKIPLRHPGPPRPKIFKKDLANLYIKQKLSSRKIAKIYHCAYSTVDRKIKAYGFPIKTLAAAHIVTKRTEFSGNIYEKAYLIGFRIGDLRVRKMYKNSETILIDCGSTKIEQINLIRKLFSKYGRVWISKTLKSGKIQIECSVNKSFVFLLKKYNQFPKWTFKNKKLFLSILAGFTDAEGSFYVSSDRKSSGFSLGNYNKTILQQIENHILEMKFHPRLFLGVRKGYQGKDGYAHREDY